MPAKVLSVLAAMALLGPPALLAKRKDDVIVMKNGDRLTGEIKKLENGQLYFKADYMLNTIQLNWALVDRLESKDLYNISLTDGRIYTGAIEKTEHPGAEPSEFSILLAEAAIPVPRKQVVSVSPVENGFWKQLTGSIDYGFSYTGGSQATQSSLSAEVAYRAEKWQAEANGSSVFNAQSGSANSGRNTLDLFYAKNLTERWFAGAVVDLLNSQQQDLTLRTLSGLGIGRMLVRTDRTALNLLMGADYTRERYAPESGLNPRVNNAEALFQVRYTMYRFAKTQLSVQGYGYPSLTTLGRFRSGVQSAFKLDLFRNFYWKLSLYENFDSHPPVQANKNDFGTSTSMGWTF